ncbi:helix-turn-helix domain-containing protein [Enterococcus cecorum]|uniref:Uncharacterized protein n=1 Tax=Enterococcus cecorum DSM 20682 = ATCC 43198 TaxID=1121864 RepID=S1QU22_9ENTE|nr:helix-turn-helix transcriptional regulator [Enterococcus cecorum]EOX17301.1 hypothetical protein I567_01240 [Enterococcus cecorum DSM 20682 = ATCC 43198]ESK60471.1 hypothetical protein OMO_02129 [Enterococcus cecorum DSM 20682 = ATCC 43198]OJG31497.1 hypothetical protein RT42_GL000712 [Enterococcus cecorum DSM 20682 = ATCC 43198]CAI3466843.1 helix-turn-helix transcriptional regulator [Enterococcus cecorum DSM 20682 = ATCC 43198]SQE54064.1 Helix-turn-helix [Enterococcus cecorum]
MNVFDRIKSLADKQGISVSKVALDLGFSENLFYQWKKSSPKSDRLEKVADYFNVSVDYLLGRSENMNNTDMDTKLERMMDNAMSYDGKPISDEDRPIIKGILKAYFDNKK